MKLNRWWVPLLALGVGFAHAAATAATSARLGLVCPFQKWQVQVGFDAAQADLSYADPNDNSKSIAVEPLAKLNLPTQGRLTFTLRSKSAKQKPQVHVIASDPAGTSLEYLLTSDGTVDCISGRRYEFSGKLVSEADQGVTLDKSLSTATFPLLIITKKIMPVLREEDHQD